MTVTTSSTGPLMSEKCGAASMANSSGPDA